jgi:hypothetical protein
MPTETQRWPTAATIGALANYPCFRCLSDQQLIIVLAVILCRIVSTDRNNECTPAELISTASCSQCFSDRQLMQMLVAMVANYASTQGLVADVDALIEDAVCLNCVDPKKVRGMVVDQVERGINNGTLFNPS